MKKIIIIFFLLIGLSGFAQDRNPIIVARVVVLDGDTMPAFSLNEVWIVAPKVFKNQKEQTKYTKLVRDVKKVYPYAKLSAIKLREYNEILLSARSEKEKSQMLKLAEKQLKADFEDDVRDMTMKQGIILIKLINRETSRTSYQIVKELRGTFNAVFWQTLGKLFGINLKLEYDPLNADKQIEEIVQLIEHGAI